MASSTLLDSSSARVRSIDRAIDVLETVGTAGALTLGQIGRALGTPRSTTWIIVRTLALRGLLGYDPASRTYRTGARLAALAGSPADPVDVVETARPHLERLAAATREAALLQAPGGREVICIARIDSPEPLRYVAEVGGRRPLHATSAGKVILAWAPPAVVEEYLRAPRLRACSSRTITDPRRLRTELGRIRRVGHAVSLGEYVPQLMGVAAPVSGPGGRLVAAVNVAGPMFRMRPRRRELAAQVERAARAISAALARPGPPAPAAIEGAGAGR